MAESGGFEGNAQTLRILTKLIYARPEKPSGMKPTRAFLDGILKYKMLHSECCIERDGQLVYPDNHFLYDDQESVRQFVFQGNSMDALDNFQQNEVKSIECQIMDWADDTAYSLHDIVDGIKARFITPDSLNAWSESQGDLSSYQLQTLDDMIAEIRSGGYEPRTSQRIGEFIQACQLVPCDSPFAEFTNRHRFQLEIDRCVHEVCTLHKRIAIDLIFKSAPLQQIEFKGGYLLTRLFSAYQEHILEEGPRSLRILPDPINHWIRQSTDEAEKRRFLCDHLSALTDGQAVRAYKRLYEPGFGTLMELY